MDIKNNIPIETETILNKFSEYLDTKLYFFGSIQRSDYFHNKSDIDIDIFTVNVNTTIYKIQHFFQVSKKDFKRFYMRLGANNRLVDGYKIKIVRPEYNLKCELLIYDEKFKEGVIATHKRKNSLAFYQNFLLYILKVCHYYLYFFDSSSYYKLKQKILNVSPKTDDDFIVFND